MGRREQLLGLGLGHARPRIRDRDGERTVPAVAGRDGYLPAALCEFERIGYEIEQDLSQAGRVGDEMREPWRQLELERDASALGERRQLRHRRLKQLWGD